MENIKVYSIGKDIVEKVEKEQRQKDLKFLKETIYNRLTPMQKELISIDDVLNLYQVTAKECYYNLLTDDCGGIESEYVNHDLMVEHVEKMIRILKRVKRGSEFTDYVNNPNFVMGKEFKINFKRLLEFEESKVGKLEDYYKDNLTVLRGKLKKKLVINYVYSLYYSCDNRDSFLSDYGRDEFEKRIKSSLENISKVVYEIIKKDKVSQ